MDLKIKNTPASLASLIILSGCIAIPGSEMVKNDSCDLKTPKWTLQYETSFFDDACPNHDSDTALACLAALGIVIPALSMAVSGSIVLVGNTVHWIEYKGNCSDEELSEELEILKNSGSGNFSLSHNKDIVS